MNLLSAKILGSVYRKEPVSGFILILGVTDAVIGGVGGRWSLLTMGMTIALIGLLVRWRQVQRSTKTLATESARGLLPSAASRPQLPLLTSNKRR